MRLRSPIALTTLLVVGLVQLAASPVRAQPDPAPVEDTAITPPRLAQAVEPPWPGPADATEPVTVRFMLTIDTDGRVAAAELVTAAGEPYDAAALAAVQALAFEPARRGATPIRVKVAYDLVLRPPPPAPPEEPAERSAEPAAAEPPPPPPSGAAPVPAPDIDSAPAAPPADEGFGAVAEIDAPPREVTRRVVEGEELTKIPGTSGDALRAIEVMPGVARTSIDSGDPIIRGAAWNETQSFVHGTAVPYLYHFGGVKSAFQSHLVERVELYPGNFSARYGRSIGGVIDERVRAPRADGLHGILELSVYDSMALLEGPISDRTSVAVAARRSNIDFFFENFVPEDAYSVTAAPLYWDYQGLVNHRFGTQHTLQLMAQGSHDSLKLFFSDPSQFDPALRGQVEFSSEYHIVQANLDSRLGPDVDQKVQLSLGKFGGFTQLGPLDSDFDIYTIASRAEWGLAMSDAARLSFGWDTEVTLIDASYQGPPPSQSEGNGAQNDQSLASIDTVSLADTISIVRPAVYTELELRPAARLLLVPGVRLDYYGEIGEASLDPRLSARHEATDTTALKWGVGLYSQPPIYYESLRRLGNPDLRPIHALHTSVGLEQRVGQYLELGVEGFYKRLTDRVVATEGSAPPRFINDGVGRIYGAELSAKVKTDRTFAYLAYTLSRSERRDRNESWRLFEADQPHILALTASHDLGKGWEVGGRFRLVSGNPYTPVVAAIYDATTDGYLPIGGAAYSARNPAFHQLDARVEKEWKLRRLHLAAYLDIQNVYNAQNQEGYSYSFDYSERESYTGLPITPNLGIRGEL